ncbi:MAG: hypothetical protein JU82_05895 [Sulfuricurvum sp. MLSB]|uniref:ATP-binding protein n=1 Tax=unclassified Sulfuricurvum TaxID=2632390 RepID=UPI0005013C8C|nr:MULTISPECIES: ATP-binding protein [unclassified Sulfuricurvum]KFN39775.1 MAG: hypothetical protein JU82_05895 [Sulfuricurvum sp. MLSB]
MSKINQIEKKLQEIDATKFHKLLDAYLSKKFSCSVHSNGTKLGENKPSKGTPDSYAILQNGQYLFMEYTTQKTGITEKFLKDLEKCFDEKKTGIPSNQIDKIILACNSDLNTQDTKQFSDYCKQKNVECEFLGNSFIANELFNTYASIAKEFLNVSIDTGQILDYDDFIKTYDTNKYSTSLSTSLQHRENEIEKFHKCLEETVITLITGVAGVGKTKLALESCKTYASEKGFIFKAILNRGANIFDDMKVYFDAESERYIVLIDDVNRVHVALEYFQEYFGEKIKKGDLKIVATVRDYAKEKIFQIVPKEISYSEIELKPLDDEFIKNIVKNEYSITNPIFLERITEVSQGNPRLALMAASVAKKHDRLEAIYDVTTLYDEYFSSVKQDIEAFEQSDLLLSIVIIAFFRVVDKENTKQVELLEKAFGISIIDMWKSVEELHRLEIVDLYENNVVKVSDQILSTYLFYKIVFVDKKIKINIFLEHFFPTYKGRFVDILNPLLNTFDSQLIVEVLREPVNTLWDRCLGNEQDLYATMNVFWFLTQTNILIYFSNKINSLTVEMIDLGSLNFWQRINTNHIDDILSQLAVFRHDFTNNRKFAIELIIGYFQKQPSKLPQIITVLTDHYGVQHKSYLHNYETEKLLVDTVWKACDNGKNELVSKLFLRVCSKLLKTEFESHSQKGKLIVMSFYKLVETEELHVLRNSIFDKIVSLYANEKSQDDIEYLISKYPSGLGHRYAISDVEKWDVQNILDFITKHFDITSYTHCKIVQELLNSFDMRSIEYDKNLRVTFKHPIYEIEKILLQDGGDIYLEHSHEEQFHWDACQKIKHDRLIAFVNGYTFEDWNQLLETCIHIGKDRFREEYKFKNNLSELFHILAEKDQKLYVDVLKKYLEIGNPFLLSLNLLNLVKIVGKQNALEILHNYEFKEKEKWIFNFFIVLPVVEISANDIEQLLDNYQLFPLEALPYHLDYLTSYVQILPKIFSQVVSILIQRALNEDIRFVFCFEIIFNHVTNIFKHLNEYFDGEIELLCKAYLLCMNRDGHFDYSLHALNKLIDLDNTFVEQFIAKLFEKDGYISSYSIQRDFTLILNRDDFESIFSRIIEAVYAIPSSKGIWGKGEVLKAFFLNRENQDQIDKKADNLLRNYIDKYFAKKKRMIFIFELICEFDDQRRINLIAHFLKKNHSFEMFEKLSLEPMGRSWSGSRIPSLQKEIDFYESLIKHMDNIHLLQHKQKMEQNISYLKSDIEREKKNDFMEDDY